MRFSDENQNMIHYLLFLKKIAQKKSFWNEMEWNFCAKNSAKTWNVKTFFRWNSKSDTLSTFSEKKRARFFIPKLFQTQNLARKIQPKHETQRRFSDFYFFMIHNPVCTCKNCVKIYPDIFSQNMKRKDVFQILTQNMKRNPLCTCKNCIKIYPE